MRKITIMIISFLSLLFLIIPISNGLDPTFFSNATSIYECTENGAAGTCTLSNVADTDEPDSTYEDLPANRDAISRINTTHTTQMPEYQSIDAVWACIKLYRTSKHGDIATDLCYFKAGKNNTGTWSYTNIFADSQSTCTKFPTTAGGAGETQCADMSSFYTTEAEIESAGLSWKSLEDDDANQDVYIDWMYLNVTYTAPPPDTTPPRWVEGSNATTPVSPKTYNKGVNVSFQIQCTDGKEWANATFMLGNGTIGQYVNYTKVTSPVYVQNNSANVSWINFTQDDFGGVRGYNFTWYCIDVAGNENKTDTVSYTISANTTNPSLTSSGGWTMIYGDSTTVTGTPQITDSTTVTLYRDDVSTGSNSESVTKALLAAGSYEYTANHSATKNFTVGETINTLTVNKNSSARIHVLAINGSSANGQSFVQGTILNITANATDLLLATTLYANYTGVLLNITPNVTDLNYNITDTINLVIDGVYNISVNISANENYTANATLGWITFTVTSAAADATFNIALPTAYTQISVTGETEATATAVSSWISFNFTTAATEFYIEPNVGGDKNVNQTAGEKRPIFLVYNTGTGNEKIGINMSLPTGFALCANATCDGGDCSSLKTACTPLNETADYVYMGTVNQGKKMNVTLYANKTGSVPYGQTETQVYVNSTDISA